MTLAAFLLVLGGFACTALSMRKHHVQVLGRESSRQQLLTWRIVGWLLLALGLVPCVTAENGGVGAVMWFGLLTVGALVVTLFLTYGSRTN